MMITSKLFTQKVGSVVGFLTPQIQSIYVKMTHNNVLWGGQSLDSILVTWLKNNQLQKESWHTVCMNFKYGIWRFNHSDVLDVLNKRMYPDSLNTTLTISFIKFYWTRPACTRERPTPQHQRKEPNRTRITSIPAEENSTWCVLASNQKTSSESQVKRSKDKVEQFLSMLRQVKPQRSSVQIIPGEFSLFFDVRYLILRCPAITTRTWRPNWWEEIPQSLIVSVSSNQRVYLNRKLVRSRNSSSGGMSVIRGRDFGSLPHSAQLKIITVGVTDNIWQREKCPHCILCCRSIKAPAANSSLTNYLPITHC